MNRERPMASIGGLTKKVARGGRVFLRGIALLVFFLSPIQFAPLFTIPIFTIFLKNTGFFDNLDDGSNSPVNNGWHGLASFQRFLTLHIIIVPTYMKSQ